ncbi:DEAD/DEAH box helicase family protein [Pannus brasiliensis CCIBt3594]|uniref:DEAD/DEAH box helicase family protein n=1 Tax=Pannus brasiliensis CCIBt3594 TaxID=1427578 RepID=A0AAW9QNF7_9CHRO
MKSNHSKYHAELEIPFSSSQITSRRTTSTIVHSQPEIDFAKRFIDRSVSSEFYDRATSRYKNLHRVLRICESIKTISTIPGSSGTYAKRFETLHRRIRGINISAILSYFQAYIPELDKYEHDDLDDDDDEFEQLRADILARYKLDPNSFTADQIAEIRESEEEFFAINIYQFYSRAEIAYQAEQSLHKLAISLAKDAGLPLAKLPFSSLENYNETRTGDTKIIEQARSKKAINIEIPTNYRDSKILAIHSPIGTGKNEGVAKIIADYLSLGQRVLLITPLISLSQDSYQNYNHLNPTLYSQTDNFESASLTSKFVICTINSLVKIPLNKNGSLNKFDLVIVDESEYSLETLLTSPTLSYREHIITKIKIWSREASQIILMDAFLSALTLSYFEQACTKNGEQPSIQILINHNAYPKTFKPYNSAAGAIASITNEVLNSVKSGQKIAIATDSKTEARLLEKLIIERFPTTKLLSIYRGQTSANEKLIEQFLSNPTVESSNYQVIIYTQRMTAGVSIKNDEFQNVFLFAGSMVTDAKNLHQLCGRFRKASTIHYQIQPKVDLKKLNLTPVCPVEVMEKVMSGAKANELISPKIDNTTGLSILSEDLIPDYRAYANIIANRSKSLRNLKAEFEALIDTRIHRRTICTELNNEESKPIFKLREKARSKVTAEDITGIFKITHESDKTMELNEYLDLLSAKENRTYEENCFLKNHRSRQLIQIAEKDTNSLTFRDYLGITHIFTKPKATENSLFALQSHEQALEFAHRSISGFIADYKSPVAVQKHWKESGLENFIKHHLAKYLLTSKAKSNQILALGNIKKTIADWLIENQPVGTIQSVAEFQESLLNYARKNREELQDLFGLNPSALVIPETLDNDAESLKDLKKSQGHYFKNFLASFGIATMRTNMKIDGKVEKIRVLDSTGAIVIVANAILKARQLAIKSLNRLASKLTSTAKMDEFKATLNQMKTFEKAANIDIRSARTPFSLCSILGNPETRLPHLWEPHFLKAILEVYPLPSSELLHESPESYSWFGYLPAPKSDSELAFLREWISKNRRKFAYFTNQYGYQQIAY